MSTAVHSTLAEFIARPDRDDDQREELIAGEVIVSPAAKAWHADIVRLLRDQLAPLKDPGFVLVNDSACILGKLSMPSPDLAAVQFGRWDKAVENDGWLEGSPELVIEVASPSNRNLGQKADLYLEHGAEQVWLFYRKTRTVLVMKPDATTEARMGEILEFRNVRVPVDSIFVRP